GRNEGSKPVTLLGYGTWGVGVGQRSPQIPYGPGRSMGSGLVHIPNEQDRIDVPYNPTEGQAKGRWGRGAPGDSGSAWWQEQGGVWSIIANTFGGGDEITIGPRASSYWEWIRSIYPDTLFYDYRDAASADAATDVFDNLLLQADRKSTRLNSSHVKISYAVF